MENTTVRIKVTGMKELDAAIKRLEDAREAMVAAINGVSHTIFGNTIKVECDVELNVNEEPADSGN
ncbi:MAG: hypothetical protein GX418_12045 [Clostridiales bacterium]|nr:hypothetical protein [Clostridiales bacterium]